MADNNDAVLKILIEMGLNDSAAQQAVQRIEQVKASSQNISGGVPEAWQAWEKYKNVLNSAEGQTLGMREKVEVLHLGMRNLGASFPELGGMIRLLFNPMTAGFAAGILAIESYFNWQKKVEQKYKDMVDSAEKVNEALRKINKSGATADEQFIAVNRSMAGLNNSAHTLGIEIERDTNFAKNFEQVMEGVLENQRASDEEATKIGKDRLELLRAMGVINDSTKTKLEAQLEHQLKLKEIEDKRLGVQQKLADKISEYNQMISRVGGQPTQGQLTTAASAKEAAEAAATKNEEAIKKLPEIIKDLKNEAAAAASEARRHPFDEGEADRYRQLSTDLQNQAAALQAHYEAALAANQGLEQNKAATEQNFKNLTENSTKLQALADATTTLSNQLGTATTTATQSAASENTEFLLESINRLVKRYGGERPNQIASGSLAGLEDVLSATGFNNQQIGAIVSKLANHTLDLKQILSEVDGRIDAALGQIGQTTYNRT